MSAAPGLGRASAEGAPNDRVVGDPRDTPGSKGAPGSSGVHDSNGSAAGQAAPIEQRAAVIDLVRGVSILLVILLHVQIRIPLQHTPLFEAAPTALWHLLCRSGNEGVRMFFVISGFLITTHSLRRWGSLPAIDIRRFYQLRFARIAPTLAVLLAVLSLLHLAGVEGYTIKAERATLGRALLAAATFHVNWLEAARNFYLPACWDVLWSLSVEEIFYLLFPLGCAAYRWPRLGHALLLGLFVAGTWVRCTLIEQQMWQSKGYLCCMDAIALGCLTGVVSHGRRLSRPIVYALLVGSGALALAVLAYAKAPAFRYFADRDLHLTVLSLATAGLMVAGTRVQLGAAGAAWLRPLLACGRLSYEIYLTHMFVVLAAVAWFRSHGGPAGAVYPLLGVTLVLCWALGALVERFWSAPANRWLRQPLGARESARPRRPSSAPAASRSRT
jgi:peptidoglycan/LPS O-acetylase OafA/YrhL